MTSISRLEYIDKLDYIIKKYNNTYHRITKVEDVDVKPNMYVDFIKEINKLNLKLVIMLDYQNIKIILQKFTFQIGMERFLWLQKLKVLCRGHMLLVILTEKKFLELFTKKNWKKQIKNSFRVDN